MKPVNRRLFMKILISFFVVIFWTFTIEVVLHLFFPISYHRWEFNDDFHHLFIKNLDVVTRHSRYINYSVNVITDSVGFRSSEFNYSKSNLTKRILVVGDSHTASVKIPTEQMYTAILSQHLNENSSVKWEVINRGMEDWGTDVEYLYYTKEGYKYKPDIVLLQFTSNDFLNVYLMNITSIENNTLIVRDKFPPRSLLQKFLLWLNGKSGLYRLAAEFYEGIRGESNGSHYLFYSQGTFEYFCDTLNKTGMLIKGMQSAAFKNSSDFIVIIIPDPQLINKEHYDFWNQTIYKNYAPQKDMANSTLLLIDYFKKNKIKYVDTSDVVHETKDYINFDDGHLSITGSKKLGDLVYAKLVEFGKVDKKKKS